MPDAFQEADWVWTLELAEALRKNLGVFDVYNSGVEQRQDTAIKALRDYGDALSPVLRLLSPSLGAGSTLLTRWAKVKNQTDESIFNLYKTVKEGLNHIPFPIVVLIDELDRLEDDEIRDMARLLKAIGDFPQLTYIVAYDEKRVAQALSSKDDVKHIDRGYAYLEKIIQVRVPVPFSAPDELDAIFKLKIGTVLESSNVRLTDEVALRLAEVSRICVPDPIGNNRDINKIASDFSGRLIALGEQVDAIDCLSLCILDNKHRTTIERISEILGSRKGHLSFRKFSDFSAYVEYKRAPVGYSFASTHSKNEQDWSAKLCKTLFPHMSDGFNFEDVSIGRIYFRDSLLSLLKLSPDDADAAYEKGIRIKNALLRSDFNYISKPSDPMRLNDSLQIAEPYLLELDSNTNRKIIIGLSDWLETHCTSKAHRAQFEPHIILSLGGFANRLIRWSTSEIDPVKLIVGLLQKKQFFLASGMMLSAKLSRSLSVAHPQVSGTEVTSEQQKQIRNVFKSSVSSQQWKLRLPASAALATLIAPLDGDDDTEFDYRPLSEAFSNLDFFTGFITLFFTVPRGYLQDADPLNSLGVSTKVILKRHLFSDTHSDRERARLSDTDGYAFVMEQLRNTPFSNI